MEGTRLDFDGETNFVEDLDKVGEKSYFVTFFNLFSRLPKPKVGFGINDPVWLDCLHCCLGYIQKGCCIRALCVRNTMPFYYTVRHGVATKY